VTVTGRRAPSLISIAALVAGLLAGGALASGGPAQGAARAAVAPEHTLSVTGDGVGTYPSTSPLDPDVERFAITTTDATAGTVTVTAANTHPGGRVFIDGARLTGASRTITGLEEGDEISVIFIDSASSAPEVHSLMYLPAGFPALAAADIAPGSEPLADGHVMLTLGKWLTPSPFFEAAVDRNGVPAFVSTQTSSMDLKAVAPGRYSVFRPTSAAGRTGYDQVDLDSAFREVARHRTVGLVDTDAHDVIVRPDGSRYLMAYEPNATTGNTDSVIQHIAADGTTVLFSWNSKDHVDPATESVTLGTPQEKDYAHINSFQVMDDGDLLVSFRHLSAVFKIARVAHDGYAAGDVIWRFGGRLSDFDFTDLGGSADGGPCAQHTAQQLANGHILVFDNGAWTGGKLCIDPADRTGALVARTPSRVTEWSYDAAAGTATMEWDYSVPSRYALFAGSAQRLANGNTVIGWASSTEAMASEVSPTGSLLWDLKDTGSPAYFTYRAELAPVPDAIRPVVALGGSIDGATYRQDDVAYAHFSCTDRGGSSLRSCTGSVPEGTRLDTRAVGTHTVVVTAKDGDGNTTKRTATYRVIGAYRPDIAVRSSTSTWRGVGSYAPTPQSLGLTVHRSPGSRTVLVHVTNRGSRTDGVALRGEASTSWWRITYKYGGRDVTKAVTAGTFRVTGLKPGATITVSMTVTRSAASANGAQRELTLVTSSLARPALVDRFVVKAVARA
jgi:hypothetical protein